MDTFSMSLGVRSNWDTINSRAPFGCPDRTKAANAVSALQVHGSAGTPAMTSVLLIEDDEALRRLLARLLADAGYEVTGTSGGRDGLATARAMDPGVILLDLSMPDMDGWQVLDALRRDAPLPAIIVLSAHHRESDVVRALGRGADDYITKPFSPDDLLARVGAAAGRAEALITRPGSPIVEWGPLMVDLARRHVTRDGVDVDLTKSEFDLLAALLEAPTQVITRRQLLDRSRGADWAGDEHSVDVHISRLRSKLGGDDGEPSIVETVRGVGFRLALPRESTGTVAHPNEQV